MKHRRVLILSLLVVALVGGCGWWAWQAKRQYALDRELIAALVKNDSNQAAALVHAGADPNTRYAPSLSPAFKLLVNQLLRRSFVPAHPTPTAFMIVCGVPFYDPADARVTYTYREDLPLARAMLEHGADCNAEGGYNRSALTWAVITPNPRTAQLLLEHGANVNAQDYDGYVPLMWAVMRNNTNMTRLLLTHSANLHTQDAQGETALELAVVSQDAKIVIPELLAHGADPNHADRYGTTPIMLAHQLHYLEIEALLRKDAK